MKKSFIKRISTMLAVSTILTLCSSLTSFAYTGSETVNITSNAYFELYGFTSEITWPDGWKVTLQEEGADEIDITDRAKSNTNSGTLKAAIKLTVAECFKIQHMRVYDSNNDVVGSGSAIFMGDKFKNVWDFADKYGTDINVYNSVIKIDPSLGVPSSTYSSTTACKTLHDTTPGYINATADAKITYTVNVPAGTYDVYAFNTGGTYTKAANKITIGNTSIGPDNWETGFNKAGTLTFEGGECKIVYGGATEGRLAPPDIWLVPTNVTNTPYAGFEVKAVEFEKNNGEDVTRLNDVTNILKANVYVQAWGHGSSANDTVQVIAGIYDNNGRMLNAVGGQKEVEPLVTSNTQWGAEKTSRLAYKPVEVTLDITDNVVGAFKSEYPTADNVRVFVWDSLNILNPLSKAASIEYTAE